MHQTIIDLLRTADQDALALGGIGRPPNISELIAQAEATVAASTRGHRPERPGRHRAAQRTRNGERLFIGRMRRDDGTSQSDVREEELNFYLSDLNAKRSWWRTAARPGA